MLSGRGVRAYNSDGEISFTLTVGEVSVVVGINDAIGCGSTTAPDPPVARGVRINQIGTTTSVSRDFAVSMYGPLNGEIPFGENFLREIVLDDYNDVERTYVMADNDAWTAPSTFGSWEWGDGTDDVYRAGDDGETKPVTIRWGHQL